MSKQLNFFSLCFVSISTLSCVLLSGCSIARDKNKVFIFAFETLGPDRVDCSTANPFPAESEILCHEFVRFGHAYSPSTSVEVALASVLTGLRPDEMNFSDPSREWLQNGLENSAQALSETHETALFVGGPSLTRRHNLQKGFRVFDDLYPVSAPSSNKGPAIGRSLESLLQAYKDFEKDQKKKNSFSLFFIPNTSLTQDSFQQLEGFFRELKKNRSWGNSEVLILGLRGDSQPSDELKSNNMQVGFFWKPTHQKKDENRASQWDRNVSLADIGKTFLQREGFSQEVKSGGSRSLDPILQRKESDEQDLRLITSQNTKGDLAVRADEWLYLKDTSLHFFHTVTDRNEDVPLPLSDERVVALHEKITVWLNGEFKQPNLVSKAAPDSVSSSAGSYALMKKKDWAGLRKWAGQNVHNRQAFPAEALYLAEIRLNRKPGRTPECMNESQMTNCHDLDFAHFVRSFRSANDSEKRVSTKRIQEVLLDRRLQELNFQLGLPWKLAALPDQNATQIELFLQLPENATP